MPEVIVGTGILDSDVPYLMDEHESYEYRCRLEETCMIQNICVDGYYPGDPRADIEASIHDSLGLAAPVDRIKRCSVW
eukprot:3771844-Prymnesium_polylepis.2